MLAKTVLSALAAAGLTSAHVQMSWPYPLRSEFDFENSWNEIDYSMTNPLAADGSDFPCKGYHHDPWRATAHYQAGNNYNMTLAGMAMHGGGSCQLSLSYDVGKSFQVIKSMEGGCPYPMEYDFPIPADAPGGHALFAWTWFNLIGNREMYMNCAQVEIDGSGSTSAFQSSYPDIFVANVGNGCSTVGGKHTVFENPGDVVVYDDGVTADTPPFPDCQV